MTEYLDITQVATLAGVTPATLRSYRSRGYLPEPDIMLGGSPGWAREAVDEWLASRPGRGVGGGRPRAVDE